MKKFLILLLAGVILFSGCTGPRIAKIGDNVSVDYTGSLEDGKVFDTSIESVGIENNITKPEYKPLKFTLGKNRLIKGFDEGIVGMKEGDSKTLRISPEKAYGPINPNMIQVLPVIYNESVNATIPKVFNVSLSQFEGTFGIGHKIGENIKYPGTNINLTILNLTDNASLSYNLSVGYEIISEGAPWNETVMKIDEKNITLKHDVKKNSIIQFPGTPWNSTVIDMNSENITIRHNAIPDTQINTMLGSIKVSFNETSIIMDRNHELAGKTLIFNVTLLSIDK